MRQRRANAGGAATSQPAAEDSLTLTTQARDQRLYHAVLAYRDGKYDAAEGAARRLVAAAPNFFPAVLLLGMVAARTGRAGEGIEWLRKAVGLDRRSVEAHNELAGLLRAEGRSDEAVAEAKHAVRLQPDDPGSHNNLGLSYLTAGRVPLAINHFKQAIALRSDAAMFHHNLGLAFEQQSRDLEALAAFRHALSLDSGHAETFTHLGRLLYQHGEPEEAARCYERAAVLQPDATIAAINRAEALIQHGRAVEAELCLRRALAADARSDLGHQVLGVLLQRLGRFDEATASLERAIELQPKRISAYVALVRSKRIGPADDQLVQGMLALVDDGTLTGHDRSRLHYALGKAYDDLGDCASAIRQFDRAHVIEVDHMRHGGRFFDRRNHKAGVDRTIAGFTAGFFVHRRAEGAASDLPVLIVGMPRSGTTLVEQILSSHREIGGAGELSFWTDRRALAGLALSGALQSDRLRRLADDYIALLRAAAPAARRVTDKMPANFLVLGLVHLVLPQARIIHCRRNPIDTCLSIYATAFGNPLDFAHDRRDIVFYYEQYDRLMTHWREVLPADCLFEIDYEALVADPAAVTRAMIAFCGLDWDDACLSPEHSDHIIMTPSVWQARQPVYRDAADRWRRYESWLGDFRRLQDEAPSDR
jgi:tetratricopeptide (TPR) repeat protein